MKRNDVGNNNFDFILYKGLIDVLIEVKIKVN